MTKPELIARLIDLRDEISSKVSEFNELLENNDDELNLNLFLPNLKAYVFDHLNEHIDNGNPYNQSLTSIITSLSVEVDNSELDSEVLSEEE